MLQLGIFDIDEPEFVKRLEERYQKRYKRIRKPNSLDRSQHPTRNNINPPSKEYMIPISIFIELKRMLKTQHEYGDNYVYFQITNKVFGISSVVYSIIALVASQAKISNLGHMDVWFTPCISFFSIVFVLIALYLSPTARVSQYIMSWKKINEGINID